MHKLRAMMIAPRQCWPLNTGAKLRNYHVALGLARTSRLNFVSFGEVVARNGRPCAEYERLSAVCESVTTVSPPRAYTIPKLVRGAMGETPLPVLNYTSPQLNAAVSNHPVDIVQLEGLHLYGCLRVLRDREPRPRLVLDWHNVESELMQRYSEHAKSPLKRAYARATARRLKELERRVLEEFDAHLVVSERDRRHLLDLSPRARVHVVPNGVDTEYFSVENVKRAYATWADRQPLTPSRFRILFVGSMDYLANVDGVRFLATEVWPRVRAKHPEVVLTIVGRNPTRQVLELGRLPGIEVTGTVDDVRPYYHEARAVVVPLRVGGGSRLKILEAMAAGVPVVSTTLGAEGLEVRDGDDILLADTPAEIAANLLKLESSEDLSIRISARAGQLVRGRYDWRIVGAKLREIHHSLVSGTAASPAPWRSRPESACEELSARAQRNGDGSDPSYD